MNDNIDNVLSNLYNQELLREKKEQSLAAYEERIVKKILNKANLSSLAGVLANKNKELTGKARVTFTWFYELYQNFPVYLGFRKIPYTYQIQVKDLFNKFTSTSIFKEWELFYDETADKSKPIGIIFDIPGIKGTQMIIHNWNSVMEVLEDNSPYFCKYIGKGKNRQIIYLEQFDAFMDRLLLKWNVDNLNVDY